jgi:histidinol dehydrogenase
MPTDARAASDASAPAPAKIALHELATLTAAERDRLLLRAEDDLAPFLEKVVPIVEAVRREGVAALSRFARELDGADVR